MVLVAAVPVEVPLCVVGNRKVSELDAWVVSLC